MLIHRKDFIHCFIPSSFRSSPFLWVSNDSFPSGLPVGLWHNIYQGFCIGIPGRFSGFVLETCSPMLPPDPRDVGISVFPLHSGLWTHGEPYIQVIYTWGYAHLIQTGRQRTMSNAIRILVIILSSIPDSPFPPVPNDFPASALHVGPHYNVHQGSYITALCECSGTSVNDRNSPVDFGLEPFRGFQFASIWTRHPGVPAWIFRSGGLLTCSMDVFLQLVYPCTVWQVTPLEIQESNGATALSAQKGWRPNLQPRIYTPRRDICNIMTSYFRGQSQH